PEVAGELGPNTDMDASVHPPRVSRLHYEIADWLGDDLLESFPCFVVTERLATELEKAGLDGFTLDDVQVTLSPEAEELLEDVEIPTFKWLRVDGTAGEHDLGVTATAQLVVSDRALEVLRRGR